MVYTFLTYMYFTLFLSLDLLIIAHTCRPTYVLF